MTLHLVSYERFLEEIRHEKMEPGDINQLECEDLGNLVAYYLYSLTRPVAFVFVIKKSEMTPVQKIELSPMSKQSRRIRDSIQLTAISDALERIEQNLKVPTLPSRIPLGLVENPNRNEE